LTDYSTIKSDDMATILKNKTMIARKRHKCEWCGKHIEPGDTYHYTVQISEGSFITLKAHPSCNRLLYALWNARDYNYDEGISPDELESIVYEEWRETHGDQRATFQEMLEWCKQKYGVSDRLDRLYFENEDAETCEALLDHLGRAKEEGKTEITLCSAVPAPAGYEFVWCSQYGKAVDRYTCRKGNCGNYSSRPNAKRGEGCADRGSIYLHGNAETFKVE
jgi:hypothetical protein